MKKAIEMLEESLECVFKIRVYPHSDFFYEIKQTAADLIRNAIAELKAPPRWHTPEQWKKLTGESWPDDWAVYWLKKNAKSFRADDMQKADNFYDSWEVCDYGWCRRGLPFGTIFICATEAGKPPGDWRPEEAL
jgi:hypothetical protein